jgi:hypothetical protein
MHRNSHSPLPLQNADVDSADHIHNSPGHGYSTENGRALLPASVTWNIIQSHPLVRQGPVDVADVCERLRGVVQCDGPEPAFAEHEVRRAIEDNRRADTAVKFSFILVKTSSLLFGRNGCYDTLPRATFVLLFE